MDGRLRRKSFVEHSAIEALLSCSEKCTEEPFDPVVVTSSWNEVARGWRNVKPNARYLTSPEKRKKSKDKFQVGQTYSDSENQLAKVKKLAGMIANSNIILKDDSSATKHKTARNTALVKYQNCGVLSYDVPCWRFILEPKHFRYIERLGFLDIRALNDVKRSSITYSLMLDNGSMITCQEVNGRIVLFDPALTFDRHLLATYELREEHKLRSCHRTNGSCEFATDFFQTRTEDNRIKVVQTISSKSSAGACSSCEMCRHRTQDFAPNPPKLPSPKNKNSELKPLQKITPSQKKTAEDNRALGKVLIQHAFNYGRTKEVPSKSVKDNKDKKSKEGKVYHSRHTVRLDWLPITRSTIAYPYVQGIPESNSDSSSSGSSVPEQSSSSMIKSYALPRHQPKARKLTLSEAASLVPKSSKLGNAFDNLTKELKNKHEKSLSLSEPLLPSVSGTKLQVSISGIDL
ncbi:uncharacterized protein LOC116307642 [Actinia tenebrosa]|uniref:Uncharacterized protein LOC116307642 n=1 Tax=Actinia tenebrosa TaxID=6105 RepID=A0A6P8J1J8_ACTTE|nr:uncharacterized protein LOC116307642 [Actinia tenebrosa]